MNESLVFVASEARSIPGVRAVLGSLPRSFRIGEGSPRADVVTGTNWATEAQRRICDGADGVLAVPAGQTEFAGAVAVAKSRPGQVLVANRWAHSPSLSVIRDLFASVHSDTMVEADAHVSNIDLPATLEEMCVLVEALGMPISELRPIATGKKYLFISAVTERQTFLLRVRTSSLGHGTLMLRAVESEQKIDVSIPDFLAAQAAVIRHSNTTRSINYETPYESGWRVAWRLLYDVIVNGTPAPSMEGRTRIARLVDAALCEMHRKPEP